MNGNLARITRIEERARQRGQSRPRLDPSRLTPDELAEYQGYCERGEAIGLDRLTDAEVERAAQLAEWMQGAPRYDPLALTPMERDEAAGYAARVRALGVDGLTPAKKERVAELRELMEGAPR